MNNKELDKKVKDSMKVSKSAEKERLKQERISKLGKSLLKEQLKSNPQVKQMAETIKKKNPNISEKDLGLSAVAQTKRMNNMMFIERQKKEAEKQDMERLKRIRMGRE